MANIHKTDTAVPGKDAFETEIKRAEAEQRRDKRERQIFGEHPDGIGPTLGQDLGRPNPGHPVDWNDEDYDPPT